LGTLKQTPVATEPETNDTHTVIKPERIASILNEMRQQLVLIGVRIDAKGPLYNSLLVRLDEATQQLYLDELNLLDAQELLSVGDVVHIYASLRGIAIRFVMTIDNIFIEDGHMLYVGAYPTHISYLQRRDIFRVPLPLHERRSVTLQHERSELELTARLIDLSIKGFCIGVLNGTINSRWLQTHFRYFNMDLPALRPSAVPCSRFGKKVLMFDIDLFKVVKLRSINRQLYKKVSAMREGILAIIRAIKS